MRKLIIILILITLIMYLYSPKETKTVFYDNEYNFYTLSTTRASINNKNINKYFSNTEIILVKLRFNGIYQSKIGDVYCKIEDVDSTYKNIISNLNLLNKYNETDNIYFDEIRVYTNQFKIDQIINNESVIIKNYKI